MDRGHTRRYLAAAHFAELLLCVDVELAVLKRALARNLVHHRVVPEQDRSRYWTLLCVDDLVEKVVALGAVGLRPVLVTVESKAVRNRESSTSHMFISVSR